jgi:uncharacterized protein YndB with AHSA1/START domain
MATKNIVKNETELEITRLFDVPSRLLYEAWTGPEHLKHWQGAPQGFTTTSHNVDLRPGGRFRICMRSPEGVDYWLEGVYREVVPQQRLAFTHVWLDAKGKPGNETLVTITFADRGGKSELTLHQTGFPSVQARDGSKLGWNSTLDRLAEYLSGSDV